MVDVERQVNGADSTGVRQDEFDAEPGPAHKGSTMTQGQQSRGAIERRGRLFGIALFGLLVGGFTLVCSAQIIHEVWFRTVQVDVSCRGGVAGLIRALDRARSAAADANGEARALEHFRQALKPEWLERPGLTAACGGDKSALSALKALDQLRYAEEHAVRYEAVGLARQRRLVQELQSEFLSDSGAPSPTNK